MNRFYQKEYDEYGKVMNDPHTNSYTDELLEGIAPNRKGFLLTTFTKEFTQRTVFRYLTNNIISYTINIYRYDGGTSRMQTEKPFNIDLSTAKLLSYPDVFSNDSREAIAGLLLERLLKSKGYSSVDELEKENYEREKITPGDNFYITDVGIVFVFQPREIAPYGLGIQSVLLPWKEIVSFLSNEKLRMKNNTHIYGKGV
jgi:hypothetical protein